MSVNRDESIRNSILSTMVNSRLPVSGNDLGKKLGISRVAVWKHIQVLLGEGYTISSSRAGYTLESEPDHVTSSSAELYAQPVFSTASADSTMQMAEAYNENGTAFFVARNQLKGRGRQGKSWASPGGGLYLTVVFAPKLPAAYANMYLISAGIAAAELINRQYNAGCRFSWPNDLYCENQKLGGLLLEIDGESESPSICRLGLGINIETIDENKFPNAACLVNYTSHSTKKPTTRTVFSLLKPALAEAVENSTPETTRLNWEEISEETGTSIILHGKGYIISGMSLTGSLILEESNGDAWEASPGWKIIGPYRRL